MSCLKSSFWFCSSLPRKVCPHLYLLFSPWILPLFACTLLTSRYLSCRQNRSLHARYTSCSLSIPAILEYLNSHQSSRICPTFLTMAIALENPTSTFTGLLPVIRITVWLLNRMNLFCGFPSLWMLSPIRAQHQVSFALYCSLLFTTIYALAERIAVLCLGSSRIDSWVWIISVSPAHLWCAHICLMFRQEICKSQREHLEKSGGEQHRKHIANNHSWSTALCCAPAAILNAITSAAMLLYESSFDQPLPDGHTPLMQVLLGCFTLVIFMVSRYADYMIIQSSHFLCAYDILIGSVGILSLFFVRSLCDALMSVSAFSPPV